MKFLFIILMLLSLPQNLLSEPEEDYLIGGKDVLQILVYDEPDMSTDAVRVSLNGYINFPLLGKVKVSELNSSQIEEKLQHLLQDGYILNPQVSVLVMEYGSRKVFVLGAAKKPGSYELKGTTSLLEMISMAEGVADNAGDNFVILRETDKGQESIIINRRQLIDKGDLSLNITLRNLDTIYIPQAHAIYVLGEVKEPGTYELNEKNKTVLSAITRAGGFTKIAAAHKTKVVRVVNGEQQTVIVNVDDIIKRGDKLKDLDLRPEDIIIVPQGMF